MEFRISTSYGIYRVMEDCFDTTPGVLNSLLCSSQRSETGRNRIRLLLCNKFVSTQPDRITKTMVFVKPQERNHGYISMPDPVMTRQGCSPIIVISILHSTLCGLCKATCKMLGDSLHLNQKDVCNASGRDSVLKKEFSTKLLVFLICWCGFAASGKLAGKRSRWMLLVAIWRHPGILLAFTLG